MKNVDNVEMLCIQVKSTDLQRKVNVTNATKLDTGPEYATITGQ